MPMRARLVERLGVSAPAVSETVKRLEREGYLTLDSDRVMHLTETGRAYGTSMLRRHRLAELLLVDVLKVPVVAGARGGLPPRARDQPDPRGPPRRAARRPGHLPARQPDPGLGQRLRPGPAAAAVERRGRRLVRRAAHRREPADAARAHAHARGRPADARPAGRASRPPPTAGSCSTSTAATSSSRPPSRTRSTSASDPARSTVAQPGPDDRAELVRDLRAPSGRPAGGPRRRGRRRPRRARATPGRGDRHAERVAPALHDQARHAGRPARASRLAGPARRRQREGEAQHAAHVRAPPPAVRQATRAPALRPPSTHGSGGRAASAGQPRGVEPRRRLGHPAAAHPPRLLHPHDLEPERPSAASRAASRSGASTPPPAPCPSTSRRRGPAPSTCRRAGPEGGVHEA